MANTPAATAVATPAVPRFHEPKCLWIADATLGEGTLWSPREQVLYWVDILKKKLHRYRPADASRQTWTFDEEISAVAEYADAPGLIVSMRNSFAHFDPTRPGAVLRTLYAPPEEPATNRFNDGKCDAQGRFWGGTMDFDCKLPTGQLYAYAGDGSCVRHVLDFIVTNGPTWSLDGRTIFVNDTAGRTVYAWDFDIETGAISNRRAWLRFSEADGHPDGMTTDAAGRLWIAHWGGACITCHDPADGAELARVKMPASNITNCAFGGPQMRTLFVTCARSGLSADALDAEPLAGGLFAVETDAVGLAAHRFR